MNEEFNPKDVENENPYRRFSPTAKASIVIGFLIFIGAGIYFAVQYYKEWKEEKAVTIEKVEEVMSTDGATYEDYVFNFKSAGIEKPIADYVYSVKIEGEGKEKVDPMYNDPYVGFFENKNLHGALWEVEDGYLHFLYDPETNEVVSMVDWSNDYETALEINKKRGEKSVLTLEAMNENDSNKRNEFVQQIKKLNDELVKLYDQVNNNLGHN